MQRGEVVLGGSAAPGIRDSRADDLQVETATRSTISAVQDVFAEVVTAPWPAASGGMPEAGARVADGVLRAWFGSEEDPFLALAPLGVPR